MTLPSHCEDCGALLQGGATIHGPNCWVRKLIEKLFPPAPEQCKPTEPAPNGPLKPS